VFLATPFLDVSKREIIKRGLELGIYPEETFSCSSPNDDQPCGICQQCIKRTTALEELSAEAVSV
jgi:7-cyano-7-deazaguanine synthase